MLDNFTHTLKTSFFITDANNTVIWGHSNEEFNYHYPLVVDGKILGEVYGQEDNITPICQMLNYILNQELEKRILAADTLEKYEEINFLYDISHKISSCLTLEDIMQVVREETHKLIQNHQISFMFLNELGELEIFSYQGEKFSKSKGTIQSIAGHVLRSGEAEMVNNVHEDPRYIAENADIKCLICAPLKVQNQTIGVIKISHYEPIKYTSEQLKLFTSLTSQAAVAIQTAQYYDQLKEYSQTLENKVIERTEKLEIYNQKLHQKNQELQEVKEKLQYLATIDELTQVYNRRYFNEYLEREWKRLARDRRFMSLILCDIDYFKLYNDCYLHQAGDKCLYRVAQYLKQTVKRPADVVARLGGEEFIIILSDTNLLGAEKVAETICSGIESLAIPHDCSLCSSYVTLSLGVATTIPTKDVLPEKLIQAADTALYEAKEKGRNCSYSFEFRPSVL
ncbi:MAG: diguanylate cyclase [Crocosphaera sp.]|nr:diguanylate cyclase [Crocosphaera sp.]